MRHLSYDELLMLAEDDEPSASLKMHLSGCSSCSAELSRLRALLSAVATIEEHPLDERLLGRMAEGIVERISSLPDERRPIRRERKWWHSAKWASAAALPLAAAMLLFLLPRNGGFSPPMYFGSAPSSADSLLSPDQWDMVWDSLTENMPELSVLNRIPMIDESPYDQLRDLTENELENLLDLLGGSDFS